MSSFSSRLPLSASETLQHRPLGKHLNLSTNGDLWHIMHRQLLHRGPNTIIFAKTKGHALEDHAFLRRFPELREEALGNDQADKAAKHARTTCFNPHVVRLSNTFAERTGKYTHNSSPIYMPSLLGCMLLRKTSAKHLRSTWTQTDAAHPWETKYCTPCRHHHPISNPFRCTLRHLKSWSMSIWQQQDH